MFEFSGRALRAGLETLVGQIRPTGHTLETHVMTHIIEIFLSCLASKVLTKSPCSAVHLNAIDLEWVTNIEWGILFMEFI